MQCRWGKKRLTASNSYALADLSGAAHIPHSISVCHAEKERQYGGKEWDWFGPSRSGEVRIMDCGDAVEWSLGDFRGEDT